MNERIKELAKQARQIGEYVNYGQIRLSTQQFEQKFAELIVKKCANLASEETSLPYNSYSEKIKKHFGVD